jgi:uncharacterized protein (DUF983 family)
MNTLSKKQQPLLINIWNEKCPHCGEGKVFEKKEHWYQVMPKMKHHCESCHYRFDREPGYFLGAMYISYALAVGIGIATFVTMKFLFPKLDLAWILCTMSLLILGFAQKNFKLSRIIYIHLFPW